MPEDNQIEKTDKPQSRKQFSATKFLLAEYEALTPHVGLTEFAPLTIDILDRKANDNELFEELSVAKTKVSPYKTVNQAESKQEKALAKQKMIPEDEVKMQIEQIRLAALEEGHTKGKNEAQAQIKELSEQLSQKLLDLNQKKVEFFSKIEEQSIKLALDVAKKILTVTAELKPDYITEIIKTGLACLGAEKPLRIRVSAQDMEFLQVIGLPPDLSASELGVEYVADEAIHSGCIIETDFGDIDAQLEHMWEQVREELYEVAK